MSTLNREEKDKILKTLEVDREFRYALMGLLGYTEILEKLDKHYKMLEKHWREIQKLRRDMKEGFRRHDDILEKHWIELTKLREDMVNGFKRHDEEIAELRREMNKLREDMVNGFKRHDIELTKLREDMVNGFKRHDEMFEKHWNEIQRLREDMNKGFILMNKRLSRVELELGALSEAVYTKNLLDDLMSRFKLNGEEILFKKRNVRIDEEDIDLLIETNKMIYIVEVKVKPKHEDVGRLLAKGDVVKKHYIGKEIKLILTGALIGDKIEEYAKSKGVEVYNY